MVRTVTAAILIVIFSAIPGSASSRSTAQANDLVYPSALPPLGKWMIDRDGAIAHWLGELVDGKALREPINIIIVDEVSTTADESVSRLQAASIAAGFPSRSGHSSGYQALIGGKLFSQFPRDHDRAFSNEVAEVSNDHGRLFGPYRFGAVYVFIGAFSREEVRIAQVPHHSFASFNQGRDAFARNLNRKSEFKLSEFVGLDNAIVGDPARTTADHDGIAILLRATR